MTAKRKAPYTKQVFHKAIASLRRDNKEVTAAALYGEVCANHLEEIENDRDDLFSIGLRVLCGRITSLKPDLPENPDLFQKERFPENFPLRVIRSGRVTTILVETRTLTVKMIDEQPPLKQKVAGKETDVLKRIGEMRSKGFTDETIQSYLNRG